LRAELADAFEEFATRDVSGFVGGAIATEPFLDEAERFEDKSLGTGMVGSSGLAAERGHVLQTFVEGRQQWSEGNVPAVI
jgi:hypothetical protein